MTGRESNTEGIWEKNRRAWEDLFQALYDTDKAAKRATYESSPSDSIVVVAMRGDYRVQDVVIDDEAYDDMDETDLASAIKFAYNRARRAVQRGSLERILDLRDNEIEDLSHE